MGDANKFCEYSLEPVLQRMKPATKDLSVILGCYNAGNHLDRNIVDFLTFLNTLGRSYELLIVEDGSQDGSLTVLRQLERQFPNLSVLRNPINMGKGYSIRNGVLNSSGNHIIFTDADMAYAKSNILTVLKKLDSGCPMVVGNRRLPESVYTVNNRLIKHVYRRHRIGMLFNLLIRRLFRLTIRDTQSGLKGFHREVAVQIFDHLYTNGFLFDVEIFIRSRPLGVPIEEIPVHLTYTTDESTVKQLSYFFRIVPELVRIKYRELRGAYGKTTRQEALVLDNGDTGQWWLRKRTVEEENKERTVS